MNTMNVEYFLSDTGFGEAAREDQARAGGGSGDGGGQPVQAHLQDARHQRQGPRRNRPGTLRKGK